MDCLVVTGTTVTFAYSSVQLALACRTGVPTAHVFFEASGELVFLSVTRIVIASVRLMCLYPPFLFAIVATVK